MRIQKVVFYASLLVLFLSLLTAVWGTEPDGSRDSKSIPPDRTQNAWLEVISIPLPGGGATVLRASDGYPASPKGMSGTVEGEPSVLLLDAGPPWSGNLLAAQLEALGVRRLDALFLTSASEEQVGGTPALSGRIGVRRIFRPSGLLPERPGLSLQTVLSGLGGAPIAVDAGDDRQLGPIHVRVLAPHPDEPPTSNVLLIEAAGYRVLYMASSSPDAEERLLGRYGTLPAHVLFVADGGSRHSAKASWLTAVQPEVAIIQEHPKAGLERPAGTVLERLDRAGVKTYLPGSEGILCLRLDVNGIHRCP